MLFIVYMISMQILVKILAMIGCQERWTMNSHSKWQIQGPFQIAYHLNSLNRDNYQFWVSLLYIFLENNFRMLFRMPSEDLHIAANFDPGLSRLSESR